MSFSFKIEKKIGRARAATLTTPHGDIQTPAFVTVGTKATVKALTPEEVVEVGAQVVLANTYHLYLEPGDEIIRDAGGLHKFMNWNGPTMTDSGGFQVFSLGSAFGKGASKIAERGASVPEIIKQGSDEAASVHQSLAKIDEDGVSFKSVIDGSAHRFTPERSIEIQHNIGADMIFAFDECTSPHAPYEYQREAMDRTHRWAKRSLEYHLANVKREVKIAGGTEHSKNADLHKSDKNLVTFTGVDEKNNENSAAQPLQALFGIVQGGRHEDLRKESAKIIGSMTVKDVTGADVGFDGFGIGGSFDKEDMYGVVGWVNDILPENKPRHLLGIGEPADLFGGIENGADLFDCVAATRIARNGTLYTKNGQININNAKYKTDFGKIDTCACYTCAHYTPAYLSHLFRSKEMLAATLASIHNVYFIVNLVKKIRATIIDGTFAEFKAAFLKSYYK